MTSLMICEPSVLLRNVWMFCSATVCGPLPSGSSSQGLLDVSFLLLFLATPKPALRYYYAYLCLRARLGHQFGGFFCAPISNCPVCPIRMYQCTYGDVRRRNCSNVIPVMQLTPTFLYVL